MDSYARLHKVLRDSFNKQDICIIAGTVISIEDDDTCTLEVDNDLKISDVRLKIDIQSTGDKVVLYPVLGSLALAGSLTGDFKDLVLLKSERASKIIVAEGGLIVEFDSIAGKVEVSKNGVSLKGLFDTVVSIFQNLKLYTPSGPSGTPLPDTVAALEDFQNNINVLLK